MEFSERYINPFTDFGFKKLFGTEFNKELLIDFLNQVLQGKEQIQQLTYLNTEQLGKTEADRKAVYDLYCENESGEKFIIELQNVSQQYFKDRSIYYATFPVQSQASRGSDWNFELKAVYTIGILNFTFPDKNNEHRFFREIVLMDRHTNEVFYDKLTFIYLEMPNFMKQEEELETQFEKWLYVLRHLPRLQERPARLLEKIFERLFEQAEIAKLNPSDMNAYEQSLKIYRDNQNTMDYAKKIAHEQGLAEGRQKGLQEGRQEERIAIATMLKQNGVAVELIERSTGLTREQIEKL